MTKPAAALLARVRSRVENARFPALSLPALGAAALSFASLAAVQLAQAEEPAAAYPRVSGELVITIEDDFTFSSDDPAAELNDLYSDSELLTEFQFSPSVKLVSLLHFEPVKDPTNDQAFADQGFYVEELYLQYDNDRFSLYGGKIHPAFGLAWESAPGVFGTDFAEDYEIAERIGAGFEVPFLAFGGEHAVSAGAFFADTTILSNSAFTNRGRLDKADGGVSNTETPESFSLALDGDVPALPFRYHLGGQYQKRGSGDPEDQSGFAGGLTFERSLSDDTSLEGIAEAAYIVNQDGQPGDAYYTTVGGIYNFGPWAAMASYTLRDQHSGSTDHLANFTLGYQVEVGPGELGIEAGYRFAREGGLNSHGLGAIIGYSIGF